MAIIHSIDAITGEFVEFDLSNLAGSIYIIDDIGNTLLMDLSAPSGIVYLTDANTGETKTIDLSSPTGTLKVIDPNTGQFVEIDFSNPSYTINLIDADSGQFVVYSGGN